MQNTVRHLAELVGGNIVGDPDLTIEAARTLQECGPNDIAFLESPKYLPQFVASPARVALAPPGLGSAGKTMIEVADPLMAFVTVFRHLQGPVADQPVGIHPRADVDATAVVGADAFVAAFAQIGPGCILGKRCRLHAGVVLASNCRLGDDVTLYPHVVVYGQTVLGDRVTIHANSVIGADGFGYRFKQGVHVKVPHLCNVIIENDVEIGACTTIDRGAFKPTRIGAGTKIDNQVQIAHNCQIGKHNLFAALVGIGGSCTTGDYVTLAGQVGVADHVDIGAGSIAAGQSGVISSAPEGARLMGMPARPARDQRRIHATEDKLPEMRRDLQRIKKQLGLPDEAAA